MPDVAEVKDIMGAGAEGPMRIRFYNPNPNATALQPALILIHGGGWCLNSVESHDSVCRGLANLADIVVLSLDYRLAPEHQFPAGLEDCYAATQWVSKNAQQLNLDPRRLAIGARLVTATWTLNLSQLTSHPVTKVVEASLLSLVASAIYALLTELIMTWHA